VKAHPVAAALLAVFPVLAGLSSRSVAATPPPSAAASASSSASSAPPSASASSRRSSVGVAPDPEPLVTRQKWVYELVYHEGAVFTGTPAPRDAGKPTETPRRMGRFAIELYNGPDLVERVRFELPMLNGDPYTGKQRPRGALPDMERRVRVKMRVEVPATDRANRAVFVDRATDHRVRLPWPTQPRTP
jgi:hypothetical protein